MRAVVGFLTCGSLLTPLAAQAPSLGAAADSSPRSDSIYRLAVNPAEHRSEDFIVLLDEGIVHVEADGRTRETYRRVVQLLTRRGAEQVAEQAITFNAYRQRFTLDWSRTLRTDGTLVSAQAQVQESAVPAALEAPVYSDAKVVRVSLAGAAQGLLTDVRYTIETVNPIMPGDFSLSWSASGAALTRRSRFVVDLPATLHPHIKEFHLPTPRQTETVGERQVLNWTASDVPRIEPEPFAASTDDAAPRVAITGAADWEAVGRWYEDLASDRYEVSWLLRSALHDELRGASTVGDTLEMLYYWVVRDFRYVSVALALGGYQPRTPDDVFQSRYGDCKDKATLFIALARALGFRANPVLLRVSGRVDPDLPSASAFDHMIALIDIPPPRHRRLKAIAELGLAGLVMPIRREGSIWLYFDLTDPRVPFGSLPAVELGRFALLVPADSTPRDIAIPSDPTEDRGGDAWELTGELHADGSFSGRATVSAFAGAMGAFGRVPNAAERSQFTAAAANVVWPGAIGDSLAPYGRRDWVLTSGLTLAIRADRLLTKSGATAVLTLPFAELNWPANRMASEIASHEPRRLPLATSALVQPAEQILDIRITLPEGWQAQLPENVDAPSTFGRYIATYTQTGRVAHIVRQITGRDVVVPAERVGEVVSWLRAAGKDAVSVLVFSQGP